MKKSKTKTTSLIPDERIINRIFFIRGKKVMIDGDLAELYGVETRVLNQAVRRNLKRFPDDFMLELTKQEMEIWKSQIVTSSSENSLRSQIVTLKKGRGRHSKYLPLVFTEQGVAMLSSVLKSERAIQVNIQIMRTFTHLREILSTHKDLREKIEKMERKYDNRFKIVFDAIRRLLEAKRTEKPQIMGFRDRK
ncbi:MAG: ORF6N domain-containing protein [Patescibacteria group bacterium]|nr:ORF6N domain-containing protein [Patescibacteria group bacterium]